MTEDRLAGYDDILRHRAALEEAGFTVDDLVVVLYQGELGFFDREEAPAGIVLEECVWLQYDVDHTIDRDSLWRGAARIMNCAEISYDFRDYDIGWQDDFTWTQVFKPPSTRKAHD